MARYETSHLDAFILDNLPPENQQPEFIFELPELRYGAKLNCAAELLDGAVERGFGEKPAVYSEYEQWTYRQLQSFADKIAYALTEDFRLRPGNRVLLRAPNTPMLIASWFGVLKAGGVAVTTMPLLRTKELAEIVAKGQIEFALCDERLAPELRACLDEKGNCLRRIATWGTGDASLDKLMGRYNSAFKAVDTLATDPALLAFTSGTTGAPKACVHFHRDIMAMADTFAKHVLEPQADEIFCGTPPIAFTFGLGGSVVFPFRCGAATAVFEKASPEKLIAAMEKFRVTTLFTSPTAYRAMLELLPEHDVSRLTKCVSAGEPLPKATSDAWFDATGIRIIDGIGSTEMIHIFISAKPSEIRAGSTGKPVPGYRACLLGDNDDILPPGSEGRLAVKGPTGCRYLADERQQNYVVNGWNVTGDIYRQDEDGYFWFVSRADDMIISSGYNIAGPEVESALLSHEAVKECAVVGIPDSLRGSVVKAFIVLQNGFEGDPALVKLLQDHVKHTIAPYKYPRAIEFVDELPKTNTGKLKRFALRQEAERSVQQVQRSK